MGDISLFARAVPVSCTTTVKDSYTTDCSLVDSFVRSFVRLDQIAIPDFSSGAMEHWGLITYRETVLLYSEREASVFNRQRVAVVVAHELAHMVSADLTTPPHSVALGGNPIPTPHTHMKPIDFPSPSPHTHKICDNVRVKIIPH